MPTKLGQVDSERELEIRVRARYSEWLKEKGFEDDMATRARFASDVAMDEFGLSAMRVIKLLSRHS